ncbi:MAG: aspartate-semialdehyde dehydrogenase [Methanomassiliicoccales archaeon]|nr:aspartate-semialdehyde dehydrogenase [Methanomassiliicoccales archaeon]
MKKTQIAVLGATGMIGQRFVQLLEDHPWFDIQGLYASERSDGKRLSEVVKVKDYGFMAETLERKVEQIDIKKIAKSCRVAFSGLPSEIAKDYETDLANAGVAVFSNAGSHRMDPDVPLLIPEVNSEHLAMIKAQQTYKNGGFIVTNANCSTTGLAVPAKALQDAYGLQQVIVSTYQAVSGAGYPGVPSLDIIGNVIPYIKNEEEKMEEELHKMLGTIKGTKLKYASFGMLANCARVPVHDGHLESAVILTGKDCTCEEAMATMRAFRPEPQRLKLPTAPLEPIIVREELDRPQPLWDLNAGQPARARGMSVTVGRLRKKDKYLKMFLISHNTIRGGAGGSVLNAELAMAKGVLR